MKKIIIFATTLFVGAAMMAQSYVSTEPSNKNVILEEFTGVNCGYCPDGHRIANEICASHPGRVFAINIHTGGYAADYTTQWGNAIASQTGLTGYPAGTVNRHKFNGSSVTALNRGSWDGAATQILAQASPVNVASRAEIDFATRTMTVDVEIYYTDSSAVSTNALNVAILQNNILGPQGGASSNPDQVVGGQYNHMHMLRHLVTGQWGETIETTTAGTFVHKTYTYNVPDVIYNAESSTSVSHEVVLEDLDVIVFVAEGHQEILSGCKAEMTYVNAFPKISKLEEVVVMDCDVNFATKATIKNLSNETVTGAQINYTIGTVDQNFDYTGTIAPGESAVVELPTVAASFVGGQTYNYSATLVGLNGEPFQGNTQTISLKKDAYEVEGPFTFVLTTDQYASESSFDITSSTGTTIVSGGPWGNAAQLRPRTYNFNPEAGCYIITVYDAYGDGINNGYGAGSIALSNASGEIFHHNGKFTDVVRFFINVTSDGDGTVDVLAADNNNLQLYPNPTSNVLNIACNAEVLSVYVYDMSGRVVMSQNGNINSIETSNLANGVYTIRVNTANGVSVEKFVKE